MDDRYTPEEMQTIDQAFNEEPLLAQEPSFTSSDPTNQKPKKLNTLKNAFSLLALAVVVGSSLFFANRVSKPVYTPKKSAAQSFFPVKYMNVYYLPPESPWATRTQDLADLRQSLRVYLGYASAYKHNINNQIVTFNEVVPMVWRNEKRPVIADVPVKNKNIAAQFKLMFNEQRASEGGKSICQLIAENNLDEVWLWVDPNKDTAPGNEFSIVNSNSNYGTLYFGSDICNSSKSFVVLGFDVNFPVGGAVHSFSHYMETLVKNLQGGALVEGLFQGVKPKQGDVVKSVPYPPYQMSERCGNVHTPPNVPLDSLNEYPGYDYANTAVVNSMCDNWQPDGLGAKTAVSFSNWKNMVMPQVPVSATISANESYYIWWLQNMPQTGSAQIYNGKPLPAWWTFVSNTDQIIKENLAGNYWMNPELVAPVDASPTAFCTAPSGLTSSCTSSGTTLGAHTENDSVLGATTYGNLALVTVLYSGSTPTVTGATFCGNAMARVGTGPSLGGGMKTEMWYLKNPPAGACPVTVTFSAEPGQRVISSTVFNNIDQVSPVGAYTTGGYSGPYTATPGTMSISLTGPKDSLMLCTYAQYSEQTNPPSANFATAGAGTMQLWRFEDPKLSTGQNANIWGGLGAGTQRTSDNQNTTLLWTFVKQQPSTYTCANLNVKPFTVTATSTPVPTTPTPVPTVPPTPTPTPTSIPGALPTVDLKMNSGDIFFFDTSLKTLLAQKYTLSWTSTNATSCAIKYGDWLGATTAQPTNGTVSLGTGSTSNVWQLNCTGPNGVASDVTRVLTIAGPRTIAPVVGLFANNVDTAAYKGDGGVVRSLVVKSGTPVTLTWSVYGAKSCTASGSWSGAKTITGGTLYMGAITAAKTYTLSCTNGTYSTVTNVKVTVK